MSQIDLYAVLKLVGQLNDSAEADSASERFRNYLQDNIQNAADVRSYVEAALAQSGDQYNKALQDLINHVGQLLGFEVVYGRYRGVRGEIGYDGLWRSPSGQLIVVEAKTTDVYTVKTSTLLGYINDLVSAGELTNADKALGLYVYGRLDARTNQLENAIIVEGRREQLRLVSVDALLHLLALKQDYGLPHSTVLSLFLPAPVKVDFLVNLISDIVAQEKEDEEEASDAIGVPSVEQAKELTERELDRDEKPAANLVPLDESYTGKAIEAVTLFGERYEAHTWKEAALLVFEALRQRDSDAFAEVAVNIRGRKRPYITPNPNELRSPQLIPGTTLYFETNLSANFMVKLCYTLLEMLSFPRTDLRFEVEP